MQRARIIRPSSSRTQPACYHFPTFRLGCFLPQMAWIVLCKASPDPIWFWPGSYCAKPARILFGSGCLGFWLNRSGLEASQCAVQESSSQILAKASELICIISGMFTANKPTQSKLPQHRCVFPQSHGDISTRLPSSATENNTKNKGMISVTKPKGNQMPTDGNI